MKARKPAAILSGSLTLAVLLVVILTGILVGGFYGLDAWHGYSADMQARALDDQLAAYGAAHQSSMADELSTVEANNETLNPRSKKEYPAAVKTGGILVENDAKVLENQSSLTRSKTTYNYVSTDIPFTEESGDKTPYVFHYVPLTRAGKTWTRAMKTPIRHYNLYYYSSDGEMHYSPNSYYYTHGSLR